VVRVWNLCDAEPTPPFGAILACELEAGGAVGPHQQQEFAEVVIVVEGEGVARVGESTLPLGPGALAEVPLGRILQLENTSPDHPLRYLIVKAL
jgi:mannose-6-phosphate isomerase-like protein (cupin superfamily)